MDIGLLDKRARIEQQVVTQDPTYGTDVVTWTPLATVWCNLVDSMPSRDEQIRNGLSTNKIRSRMRIRYRGDVTTAMRVVLMRPERQVWAIIGGLAEIGVRDGIELMIERV
jgi:SPP1 family predicted phage head-tail adaptor